MSNMSYCRFTNTVRDLHDCNDNIEENMSEAENKSRLQLIKLCVEIALNYGDEVNLEVEEV